MNLSKDPGRACVKACLLFLGTFIFWGVLLPTKLIASTEMGSVRGKVRINGALASNVVVYLLADGAKAPFLEPVDLSVIQTQNRFDPVFSVVTVGSIVRFENHDDDIHNVHSKSPKNRFDIGAHMPNTVKTQVFTAPGIVPIRCKVHPDMKASIFVAPTPFFSITDAEGRFEIGKLPPGRHVIHAWHRSLTNQERALGLRRIEFIEGTAFVDLNFESENSERDLSEIFDTNWTLVVEQIDTALLKALSRWERKKTTAAALAVMTARSTLFHESGLKEAISESKGEKVSQAHDLQFDKIRKWMQGIGGKTVTASELKKEIALFVKSLKNDSKKIAVLQRSEK
ncbi:MAG: hypothetical protein ACE5GK_05795 [Nitrospiria bacterium]